MIVLDTNVVSELFSRRSNERVISWLNAQEWSSLCISSIVLAELYFGAYKVGEDGRRETLLQTIYRLKQDFVGRVLVFGDSAAERYGAITAERQRAGSPIETKDAMIASICLVHDAILATRNTKDFNGIDLRIANPFEAGG